MSEPEEYVIGPAFCAPFGAIIQWFARCENVMTIMASAITGIEVPHAIMMMVELGYSGKRNTIRCLILSGIKDAKTREKVIWYLGQIHKHNQLRNNIAHRVWVAGKRPNSVKPMGLSIRGGKPDFAGLFDDEQDWTVDELWAAANDLGKTYNDLTGYCHEKQLFPVMSE